MTELRGGLFRPMTEEEKASPRDVLRLRKAMARGKIMRKTMAKTIGIHPTTLSKYLSGSNPMPQKVVFAGLESLGLKILVRGARGTS